VTDQRRQSRRDFLHGRAAAQALVGAITQTPGLIGEALGLEPTPKFGDSPLDPTNRLQPLMSLRRRAMACEFEVQLATGRDADAVECVLDALDLVETLEAQMTIYRTDSEVLRINRMATLRPVTVESRLFALFQMAAQLQRDTNGAFDITTGPLSEAWGFSRREGRMPSDAEIAAALKRVGMHHVELDAATQTVAFCQPGVSLHLNCIGKGHALDRMAELLTEGDVGDVLLHGGRSSVLARGDCPGNGQKGWTIGLRHPLRPEERLGEFVLADQSLGTSGSATQSFVHDGRRYGHLLDPRTGWPAEGVFTATVLAPTAAEADALSTAFYILGPAGTTEYCAARPEIAAVLVCPAAEGSDGDGEVCVHAFNADDSRWRPAGA
jgi:thiamine biosynthesis lipoprotein